MSQTETVIRPDVRVRAFLLGLQVAAQALVSLPAADVLLRAGRAAEAKAALLLLGLTAVLAARWVIEERGWSISAQGIVGFGLRGGYAPLADVEVVEYANIRTRYGRTSFFRLRTKRGAFRVLFARVSPPMGLFAALREIFPAHLFRYTRAENWKLRAGFPWAELARAIAIVLVLGLQLGLLPGYVRLWPDNPLVGIAVALFSVLCILDLDYRHLLLQLGPWATVMLLMPPR